MALALACSDPPIPLRIVTATPSPTVVPLPTATRTPTRTPYLIPVMARPTDTPAPSPTPSPTRPAYASCEAAIAAETERVKGERGNGWGFPEWMVPGAIDGDGDGVVCER